VIPVVILLSWFFLLIRYKAVHFIGIVVCILGMGCMVGADVLVGRHQGAGESWSGHQVTHLYEWNQKET
jgi:solute carrier family 35 protein F1/2